MMSLIGLIVIIGAVATHIWYMHRMISAIGVMAREILNSQNERRSEPTQPQLQCRYEQCKYEHMQPAIVIKNAQPQCDPSNDSKEFIHLYDKRTGKFEGSRAIGHPDIASGHYLVRWPNGSEVQCHTS